MKSFGFTPLIVLISLVGSGCSSVSDTPLNNNMNTETNVPLQLFENAEYRVSFTYPNNWILSKTVNQGDLSVRLRPDPQNTKASLTIAVDRQPYSAPCRSGEPSDCENFEDVKSRLKKSLEGSVSTITAKDLDFKGSDAYEVLYETSYGYKSKSVYISQNGQYYIIGYLAPEEVVQQYGASFDAILNSINIRSAGNN